MKIAISGASGKTGLRIVEECKKSGYDVKLLIRNNSSLPLEFKDTEKTILDFSKQKEIENSLISCDALIIATGARPSIDILGPLKVDTLYVRNQLISCEKVGIKRIILISSLCSGKLFHPLNLFGLILICKRYGEKFLEKSNLNWTIIRPGGLNEIEDDLQNEATFFTKKDQQFEGSIPRRLVAQASVEAINLNESFNKIIEVTSNRSDKKISLKTALRHL